ncbi:MAG: hypothetical protein K940chlam9_00991, partial [Chlamydiae bacterium]|nr:hypothetical protein [Chlamydiota bacterium]
AESEPKNFVDIVQQFHFVFCQDPRYPKQYNEVSDFPDFSPVLSSTDLKFKSLTICKP